MDEWYPIMQLRWYTKKVSSQIEERILQQLWVLPGNLTLGREEKTEWRAVDVIREY